MFINALTLVWYALLFTTEAAAPTQQKQQTQLEKCADSRSYCGVILKLLGSQVCQWGLLKTYCRSSCGLCPKEYERDPAWLEYKKKQGNTYPAEEEERRYKLYRKAVKDVEAHNLNYGTGKTLYKMEVNKFATWTPNEITQMNGLKPMPSSTFQPTIEVKQTSHYPQVVMAQNAYRRKKRQSVLHLPNSIDWRRLGFVGPVKDQGQCGCCWAFAVLGALEAFHAMHTREPVVPMSEQHLVDCDIELNPAYNLQNFGCDGGFFPVALDFLARNASRHESSYPFVSQNYDPLNAVQQACRLNTEKKVAKVAMYNSKFISSVSSVAKLETAMMHKVARQPIAVGLAVDDALVRYSSGIYDGPCADTINHAVLLVGYGKENNTDFWIVKNSWGPDWGEGGFMKLKRGLNLCFVAQYWGFPTALEGFIN